MSVSDPRDPLGLDELRLVIGKLPTGQDAFR